MGRAGKMNLNLSTKMVSPDKRKGMLTVLQSDDQLMHLQWKDRTTSTIEDDLIIFPDDVEFKAVPACTTGRVFVLKFKTSNKRMFFWMQEPKSDKDEELCKKVNDNLNNPPAPGSARSGSGLASGLPAGLDFNNLGDSELQNLLNNLPTPSSSLIYSPFCQTFRFQLVRQVKVALVLQLTWLVVLLGRPFSQYSRTNSSWTR